MYTDIQRHTQTDVTVCVFACECVQLWNHAFLHKRLCAYIYVCLHAYEDISYCICMYLQVFVLIYTCMHAGTFAYVGGSDCL